MGAATPLPRQVSPRQVTVKGRKRTVYCCEAGCRHATEALALQCRHGRRIAAYYHEAGL